MKIENISKAGSANFKFSVNLNTEELASIRSKVISIYGKNVKVTGFRPGKAPMELIEKELKAESVHQEVIQQAIDSAYTKAITELKIMPVGSPKVELIKFVPYSELELIFEGDLMPEVEIPDYKKWAKLKLKEVSATKEDIEDTLNRLALQFSDKKLKDGKAEMGDEAWIDFEGTNEAGEKIDGADGKNYPLALGSGTFIPGFEEEVVGMKTGDEKTFLITFPKDYRAEGLQGKKVNFKIKVNELKSVEKAELNDQLATKISPQFKSLDDLKKDIELGIVDEKIRARNEETRNILIEKLVDESSLKTDLPEGLVETRLNEYLKGLEQRLMEAGRTEKDYFAAEGFKNKEDFIAKKLKKDVQKDLISGFALSKIAEKEELKVEKNELSDRTELMLMQYQHPDAKKMITSIEYQNRLASQILTEKVVDHLFSISTED
jgi:trigger factor